MFRSAANKFCSKLSRQKAHELRRTIFTDVFIFTNNTFFLSKYICTSSFPLIHCWDNKILTGDTKKRLYSSTSPTFDNEKKRVSVTYVEADGTSKTVDVEVGTDLMAAAHENDIELEGACGGELACSTCHLIFEPDVYDSLPEKEDEEDDMLDLAFEVTDTSRLGCQCIVKEDFEGITVQIPDDGF
mmetsp:Transcript_50915/g.57667  ORF Transcript_50915/g.57667 Transcript_50915/m.57667 type:complete len:186 (+) Transcript_50915:200-757(+)